MFTLWFMGRPASGKSTIASRVQDKLVEDEYAVENLDGDDIRKNLHPDLGFSREDRRTNNRRTAYVAQLLNRNNISTIVGMITPFRDSQQQAREIVDAEGEFVLVYVKCSLEEAEARDPKNLYEQARRGNIEKFTGVNHPFEEPLNPEIIVDTEELSPEEAVEHVFTRLEELDVLSVPLDEEYDFTITREEEQNVIEQLEKLGHI